MNKKMIGIAVISLIAVATLGTSVAFAQGPVTGDTSGNGFGGRGMRGGPDANGEGVLSEYMHAALADALGISEDELETREEAGETFYDMALALGYEADEIRSLMLEARTAAVDQAIADGVIEAGQYPGLQSDGTGFGRGGGRMGGGTGECQFVEPAVE